MLLTITTTHQPATDLGYLLHKNPAHLQTFSLNFGQAHVFYPEADEERCTAALLLDIDTIHLVRGRDKAQALEQYVNDRPYVASSFLSVALAQIFSTALSGRCAQRPELVAAPIPLRASLPVLPSRGGESWLRHLFEPLGYTVTITAQALDEQHPEWGMSSYYSVTLEATCRLRDLLTHLYVLVPVLDGDKHYWIGDEEVEKLLRHGKGWLENHPERERIALRYLRHQRSLARDALARLIVEERSTVEPQEEAEVASESEEEKIERPLSLHTQRLQAVQKVLKESGAKSVLDLGCGEGRLLKLLLQEKQFERILGLDVSYRVLELAQERLHLDRLPSKQRERITLQHGALTYRDKRLAGYDAAAVVEVIEHLDLPRLGAFERVLFEFARPGLVAITTPNVEYNIRFPTLPSGKFRHHDHRFEWTRQEFQDWSRQVAERAGYQVRFLPIGPEDESVGSPSQMGIFTRLH
jgi:3' terminal RNA ribose 2'-O-methyltransferase Hen1